MYKIFIFCFSLAARAVGGTAGGWQLALAVGGWRLAVVGWQLSVGGWRLEVVGYQKVSVRHVVTVLVIKQFLG